MVYYEDDEIIIRDIIESDVVSLFMWRIDKRVNQHDPRPIPQDSKTLRKECELYAKMFDDDIMINHEEDNKYKYFIITDKEHNPIGFINLFSINKKNKDAELGIKIGEKSYWNKGIGSKSCKVILKHIFGNLGLRRIHIETSESNIGARRLCSKLGFTQCDEYVEDENFKFIVMELVKK
ncbi:GNAT family N-acetyltransferase [Mycoplasmatota bacterium WC44]